MIRVLPDEERTLMQHGDVLQKITWDTKILNVTSVQAATFKRSATNLTCPRMSPFPIPSTCPFWIMFMTSYPPMVRRAVLKLKKPSPGLTGRFMNRFDFHTCNSPYGC
jgi:hypothetical protein